jgi:hypothetical protein
VSFRIYDVPREMVTDFWSAIEPMLSRAMRRNPHMDTAGLLKALVADFARLFVMTEGGKIVAAAVMERVSYPDNVVGNVLALAGEHGIYRNHFDAIEAHLKAWSRARGCNRIAFVGRPGLTRFVRRRGGQLVQLVHAWQDL